MDKQQMIDNIIKFLLIALIIFFTYLISSLPNRTLPWRWYKLSETERCMGAGACFKVIDWNVDLLQRTN